MNKLTKAKRDYLILVGMATLGIACGLYFMVIADQKDSIVAAEKKFSDTRDKLGKAEAVIRRSDEIQNNLNDLTDQLTKRESNLAEPRDPYKWMVENLNTFQQSHRNLNLPTPTQPELMVERPIIPKFPYTHIRYHILKAVVHYHDFGRYIADMENQFPFFRVQAVDLRALSSQTDTQDNIEANFDIVTLLQPSQTPAK